MKNKVQEQYSNWVYPDPIEDMVHAITVNNYLEIGDPLAYWPLMWPHKRSIDKLDILVAGCGTNQAAYYACRNPHWNVIGLDISDSSLEHQTKLKTKHNLVNLRLEKLDLTQVKTLGLNFDFISSTGVLHHLPNPDEGLLALKSVLRPEGVMNLMVYGTSLRLGIYMMQEVFRMLRFEQTKVDIDLVRMTVNSLDTDHVLKKYINVAEDLSYDAGIVDTFLHPQDRSYSVKEVFEFTRKAGLEFLSWCEPAVYSLEQSISKNHPLWQKINGQNLTLEQKSYINDLLVQNRGTHRWLCAHPKYVKKYRINFKNNSLLGSYLHLHRLVKLVTPSDLTLQTPAKLERETFIFEMSPLLAHVLEKMNGKTTIGSALEILIPDPGNRSELTESLIKEIESLYDRGHIYIFLPE